MLNNFRNSSIYNAAVNYASYIHKNEMRKGTNEPYVFHPIRVSKLVERYMEDDKDVENYIIAAILHDTVEAEYDKKEEVLTLGKILSKLELFSLELSLLIPQEVITNPNDINTNEIIFLSI